MACVLLVTIFTEKGTVQEQGAKNINESFKGTLPPLSIIHEGFV